MIGGQKDQQTIDVKKNKDIHIQWTPVNCTPSGPSRDSAVNRSVQLTNVRYSKALNQHGMNICEE